jgi:2'-5' RNA ligase
MGDYRNHHATIFVAPEVAGPIEAARRDWDPDMAARIAPHVTVAYPHEAPISDLLIERVAEASKNIHAFRLRLGGLGCLEGPEGGVYVNVEDLDDGYRRMRDEVLRPPFHNIAYPPHVTLLHPQTSRRGREFWDSGSYQRQGQDFTVGEVTITAFDGAKWVVLVTYPLACRR